MILHIPHSSINLNGVNFDDDVSYELNIMTDWFTNELFYHNSAEMLVFPVSRLVCDVERYESIEKEPMEKYGMGVCYTKRSNGSLLRTVTDEERTGIINDLYLPHHKRLVELFYGQESFYKNPYIVDCHSFFGTKLPHEANIERPDICLGVDAIHTPASIISELQDYFVGKGYSVLINSPFAGTMVPTKLKNNENLKCIMIEVNRDLYLNDFKKNDNFVKVQEDIEDALEIISIHENL